MVCTTSDDRSSILWAQEGIKHKKFEKKCKVYGHQARVFCCKVLPNFLITAGEDSILNIWNFDGTLLRSVEPHQGGAIRSVGYHEERNYVVSGKEAIVSHIDLKFQNIKSIKRKISISSCFSRRRRWFSNFVQCFHFGRCQEN